MLQVCVPHYGKKFRLIPYRMTLKHNPICYRWLWFNWAWGPGWADWWDWYFSPAWDGDYRD